MKTVVYLAGSSLSLPRVRCYASNLSANDNILIACRWFDHMVPGLDSFLTRDKQTSYAMKDLISVRGSHVFWLLYPKEKSASMTEFGYALARREMLGSPFKIVVSGPGTNDDVFTSFDDIDRFESDSEALDEIVKYANRAGVLR